MKLVRCPEQDRWRAALSARFDGEENAIDDRKLDAHLGACASCRAWADRLNHVADRVTDGADALVGPDLSLRLIGVTEAHICGCHVGGACECTDCQCTDCTCGRTVGL